MQHEAYDREWLIQNKFPGLARQIRMGDFKIVIGEEGKKIVQFTNLSVFGPNAKLIERILSEIFIDVPLEEIVFGPCGLLGLEIFRK